jgi:hypothetical protein
VSIQHRPWILHESTRCYIILQEFYKHGCTGPGECYIELSLLSCTLPCTNLD